MKKVRKILVEQGHGGACTSAYVITLEAARRVRRAQTPVLTVCDGTFRLWDRGVWDKTVPRGQPTSREAVSATPLDELPHAGPPLRVLHTIPPLGWQSHMGLPNEIGAHCYVKGENAPDSVGCG